MALLSSISTQSSSAHVEERDHSQTRKRWSQECIVLSLLTESRQYPRALLWLQPKRITIYGVTSCSDLVCQLLILQLRYPESKTVLNTKQRIYDNRVYFFFIYEHDFFILWIRLFFIHEHDCTVCYWESKPSSITVWLQVWIPVFCKSPKGWGHRHTRH